ncbi:MAG: hypothetical protein XE05_1034 [Thermotogales bacterium 46_20]|nr:MAG: hypothetical protein XE05_1034 [Thermotogales bacterium 46_20]
MKGLTRVKRVVLFTFVMLVFTSIVSTEESAGGVNMLPIPFEIPFYRQSRRPLYGEKS